MKYYVQLFLGFFALIFSSPMFGDYQKITLSWDTTYCDVICGKAFERELSLLNIITNYSVDPSTGHADISWMPNEPFSLAPIKSAADRVGIKITQILVAVRGTLKVDPFNITLISLGDSTPFVLLNHPPANASTQGFKYNLYVRALSASRRLELIQYANANQMLTVEGVLFEPFYFSPQFYLYDDAIRLNYQPSNRPLPSDAGSLNTTSGNLYQKQYQQY